MAGNDDTAPTGAGQSDLDMETKRVLAEVTVILEAVAAGLESLQRLPEAALLRNQLEMLLALLARAEESVKGLFAQLSRQT